MTRYNVDNVNEGDTVEVSTWEGTRRRGVVVEVSEEIKNGYPGIGYEGANGEFWWCYMDQIVNLTKKAT
jgi:hypothetical protein